MRTLMLSLALLVAGSALAAQDPADSAWAAGEHQRARTLYAARVAADSSDALALHRLGLLLAWNREYPEAVTLLDRLLRLAPSPEARAERANVLAWSGDYARAVEAIDELLDSDPLSVDLWSARAKFLSWSRRFDEAVAGYERLEQLMPGDTAAAHAHARVLAWAGRLNAAESAYRALLERDPRDAEALRGLARVASWQGDLHGGERLWREAISAEPDNAEARIGLSQVLRWQGQARAALDEAEAATRVGPPDRDTELQLAWARAAFRPRIAPLLVAEFDSEDNRIVTTGLAFSGYLGRRLALTGQAYVRRADDARASDLSSESRSAALGLRADVLGGWTIGVSGGVVRRPEQDANTTTASASISTPAWSAVTAAVSGSRSVLDATALLIDNGVRIDELLITAGARLAPSLRLAASGGVADFRGDQRNRRLLGRFGIEARANRWLSVRPRFTTFGFDEDLDEGYWDPDSYRLAELGVGVDRYLEAWTLSGELSPGAQQISSDGRWKGALGLRARVQYIIAPGRDIGLGFTLSNTGIERHQAEGTSYHYQAAVLSAAWTF